MTHPRLQIIADDVIGLTVKNAAEAQSLAAHLRQSSHWLEIVPGLDSVAVRYDPASIALSSVSDQLVKAHQTMPDQPRENAAIIDIPVHYGDENGPDLKAICEALSLTPADLIARHTAPLYTVEMIGFTPGFAYLGGLDKALTVPRRSTPRSHVPAGSIGISGGYTGLYAMPGPGGWPLIGRTDTLLFNAALKEPFLIHPGLQVRFVSV